MSQQWHCVERQRWRRYHISWNHYYARRDLRDFLSYASPVLCKLLYCLLLFINYCYLLISVDIVLDFNAGTRARDQVEEQSDQKVQYLIHYLYSPIISVMQLPFKLRQNIAGPRLHEQNICAITSLPLTHKYKQQNKKNPIQSQVIFYTFS